MTQAQLAERLDVSRKLVNEIINAKAPVSPTVATRLERVTSIPAKAWLLYQAQYDADVARREDISSLAEYAYIIPVNLGSYLRKVGATSATMRDAGQLVADFLDHIQCGTINAFEQRCRLINGGAAFATLKESGRASIQQCCLPGLPKLKNKIQTAVGLLRSIQKTGLLKPSPWCESELSRPTIECSMIFARFWQMPA